MSLVGLRAVLPLAFLLTGTWLGLGRPDRRATMTMAERALTTVAGRRNLPETTWLPPRVDVPPPTPEVSDPSSIEDAGAPVATAPLPPLNLEWPRSNPEGKISRAWLLAEGPHHPPGDNHRYITFTFDDGPFPEITPHVLDLLERHRVRATFFVIGQYLEGDDARSAMARDVLRRAVAEGHLIGNHTYDHKHLTEVSRPEALAQIDRNAAIIEKVTGAAPLFFRPPFGDLSRFLERTMKERKMEVVLWSLEGDDMHCEDEKALAHEIRLQLEYAEGGIVLLHDIRWKSVVALDRLLRWLEDHRWDAAHPETVGYDIVDLPEYLRVTAASPQPYPNRQALDDARKATWRRAHPELAPPSDKPKQI
jgi:peptidoglycan/xylan/chitin deacetylase (PgdA/CDA1 family)